MDTGFHVFIILNNAAVNMGIQISLQDSDFISFENVPTSEITGMYYYIIFYEIFRIFCV